MSRCWRLATALLLAFALPACSADDAPRAEREPAALPAATSRPTATVTATVTATTSESARPSPAATPEPAVQPPDAPTTAASPTAAGTRAPVSARPAEPGTTAAGRLTGDGIDLPRGVVAFGTGYDAARPVLEAALGRPTRDTGVISSFSAYGTCPGTRLRALEWGGGALVVLFGDVTGAPLTVYSWRLTPQGTTAGLPRASALVGDVTTYEFGVGTTVTALREGAGRDAVDILPGDELTAASFRLRDQSAGFFGVLTSTSPGGTVLSVQAGRPCGE